MHQRTRFTTAVHILVSLALRDGSMTSKELAWSINTDASKVRHILRVLVRFNWICTSAGSAGGSKIATHAANITLLEVFDAVEFKSLMNVHTANRSCPLGAVITEPLATVLNESEDAARKVLGNITIATIASDVSKRIVVSRNRSLRR